MLNTFKILKIKFCLFFIFHFSFSQNVGLLYNINPEVKSFLMRGTFSPIFEQEKPVGINIIGITDSVFKSEGLNFKHIELLDTIVSVNKKFLKAYCIENELDYLIFLENPENTLAYRKYDGNASMVLNSGCNIGIATFKIAKSKATVFYRFNFLVYSLNKNGIINYGDYQISKNFTDTFNDLLKFEEKLVDDDNLVISNSHITYFKPTIKKILIKNCKSAISLIKK